MYLSMVVGVGKFVFCCVIKSLNIRKVAFLCIGKLSYQPVMARSWSIVVTNFMIMYDSDSHYFNRQGRKQLLLCLCICLYF